VPPVDSTARSATPSRNRADAEQSGHEQRVHPGNARQAVEAPSGPPAPVKKPVVAAPRWNQPAGAGSGVAPAEELVGDASDLTNRGDGVRVDRHAPVRTATSEPAHSTSLLVDDPVVSAFALVARRVKSRSMVVGLVTDDRPVVLGAIVSGTLGYGIALRLARVGTYAERVEQEQCCGRPATVR
jgi:hypothetical protein